MRTRRATYLVRVGATDRASAEMCGLHVVSRRTSVAFHRADPEPAA